MPHFALKVLAKSEIVRLKQVEHINNERAILGRVKHPFIVELSVQKFLPAKTRPNGDQPHQETAAARGNGHTNLIFPRASPVWPD